MTDRKIIIDENGLEYSDTIAIFSENGAGRRITYYCDAEHVYSYVRPMIERLLTGNTEGSIDNMTSDMIALKKRLSGLIKVALKGVLLMYGNDLLTLLFGTKNHPKPGKGDDILPWYIDMFSRVAIAYLMKHDTYVQGEIIEENENTVIRIFEVSTRSVTAATEEDKRQTDLIGRTGQQINDPVREPGGSSAA